MHEINEEQFHIECQVNKYRDTTQSRRTIQTQNPKANLLHEIRTHCSYDHCSSSLQPQFFTIPAIGLPYIRPAVINSLNTPTFV